MRQPLHTEQQMRTATDRTHKNGSINRPTDRKHCSIQTNREKKRKEEEGNTATAAARTEAPHENSGKQARLRKTAKTRKAYAGCGENTQSRTHTSLRREKV